MLVEKGPDRVSPTFIANSLVDSTSGLIAIETGAIGHNICVVTACSTGTRASARRPRRSVAATASRSSAGSTENADPRDRPCRFHEHARGRPAATRLAAPDVSRPFDLTRNGFVLGEGAGALILEDLELAKARGARIYAEVVGYGSAADGWDMIQPIEGGIGAARSMTMALERRGVPADEVDLINPHGTSTPVGDKRESDAICSPSASAARDREIAISATKSMTGHMMGAAGSFEAFATVMSVAEQCAPGTLNYLDADPECHLSVVTRPVDDDPLRDVQQHRARRAQCGGDLQALHRRLKGRGGPSAQLRSDPPCRRDRHGRGHAHRQRLRDVLGQSAAAVTGTRPITSFDPTGMEVRIAAEVVDFDPTIAMDPKMARRMSRFIHFAMAAGMEAVAASGIDFEAMSPEQRDRVGVVVNTGGGGIEQIIDGTHTFDQKGARFVSAFAIPALSGSMGPRCCRWSTRLTGTGDDPGGSLRDVGHRLPRRPPARHRRRCRCTS